MAPHVSPPSPPLSSTSSVHSDEEEVYDLNVPFKKDLLTRKSTTPYPQYLPTWDPVFFPPLQPFEFSDPALRADPLKRSLLTPDVTAMPISPKMGTELTGVQLSSLNAQQRDELALLVSERKVVVLRDQDFADIGPASQQEFADYFGKKNYQPVTGSVPGYPGFHIIYRDGNRSEIDKYFEQKSTATIWHHDVSYERQPPGYVVLCMLQCPEVGGDTVVANMTEAYKYDLTAPISRKAY
jgi:sulfonate dioxygenase